MKKSRNSHYYRPADYLNLKTWITCGLALLSCYACLQAKTVSWSGGGTTANWNDSGNWGFAGTPTNGDTLIFPAGQPRLMNSNNIIGLTLNQIRFAGASGGYALYGNAFTLTNHIMATNTAGANAISNNITLAAGNQEVRVASGATLTLAGALGGKVGLTKTSPGTLTLAGSSTNTFAGPTAVNDGVLGLAKTLANYTIVGSELIIGDGTGLSGSAVVRNFNTSQISTNPAITINGDGQFDLNGIAEIVGDSLTLNDGGDVDATSAVFTLSPNATVDVNPATAGVGNSSISGGFSVGSGVCTISVAPAFKGGIGLDIPANVSGYATIVKTGTGRIRLSAANTFTGPMHVAAGLLEITDSAALGTTGGTTLSNTAFLRISGDLFVSGEGLTNASTYATGAIDVTSGSNVWNGPILLGADSSIDVATNCWLNLISTISGSGGFTKSGPGRLLLSGSSGNTYSGNTTVNEGRLELNKSGGWAIGAGWLIIGDGVGGDLADIVRYTGTSSSELNASVPIAITRSGWLDLNNKTDVVGTIWMGGGMITTGTGVIKPGNISATDDPAVIYGNLELTGTRTFHIIALGLAVYASISGNGGLTKTGESPLSLQSSNSYAGLTTIAEGQVAAYDSAAFGATGAGTVVSNGAGMILHDGVNVGNEPLSLSGSGYNGNNALWSVNDGVASWAGPITLASDTVIGVYGPNGRLTFSGAIDGPGGLTKSRHTYGHDGTLVLSGAAANTYGGTTRVDGGRLLLNKSVFDGAIPHDLSIANLSVETNTVVVRLLTPNQIANSSGVTIQNTGLLDIAADYEGIDTLSGSGRVALSGGYLSVGYGNGSSTFSGVISGNDDFKKYGTGTITLTGTNTYLGTTFANAGNLVINGYQPQSPVTVASAGSLGGTGTVGQIYCLGGLMPGNSPGLLTSSNLTFTSAGNYYVELNGTTPGVSYDQMNVRGTNNLANATLHLTAAFPPTDPLFVGDQFLILNNHGDHSINGTFSGLPEGATLNVGGNRFAISYARSSGNDVVLTAVDVPGAQSGAARVTTGNGNHIIDPNECDHLTLVLTNQTGTPMTGVSAQLFSSADSVLVTQPASSYANVPANGTSTNLTPFQIALLPSYVCGKDIPLDLVVSTATHGDFSVPITLASTAGPAAVPVRYDNDTLTNLPDVGTIESTNVVIGFTKRLKKVTASLWLTHPLDADLSLSLISPSGTVVNLSSGNGGSGDDYGTDAMPDRNRTTFDDSAATSITAGSPPFAGKFRPEVKLTAFEDEPANGNWRLRVKDVGAGSVGALRDWSLFLYPVACDDGGGYCDTCPGVYTGSLAAGDLIMTNRLERNSVASSCTLPKTCLGEWYIKAPYRYDTYSFTNTGPATCVSVALVTACADAIHASAYLGSFDTNDVCSNYLGDMGYGPPELNSFSVSLPAGAKMVVVVNEVYGGGCGDYQLVVSGLPCPQPTLAADAMPDKVRVHWPTWAGGYLLDATTNLTAPAWLSVTNEPTVSGGRYTVTNTSTTPTNKFYRLHKTP